MTQRILRATVVLALAALPCCKRERLTGVATADCPAEEKAISITVADGRVLLDKPGAYDRICPPAGPPIGKGATGCVDHHFYVFPLVPSVWTAADPVPAWVTCQGAHKNLADCHTEVSAYRGDLGGSVAVRVGDGSRLGRAVSGWETAVEDATKRHGVTAAPRAPVLRLGKP